MKNRDRCLVHWSPPSENYFRSSSLDQEVGDGTIYCQAVVQVLFADSNKEWSVGHVGEIILYKTKPKRSIDSDLFLSFFASQRYRFLIKLSEGAKFWRTKNFVAIYHGRLIGLNFAIEHSQQAEILIKHMQNFYSPPPQLSERFFRALKIFRRPQKSEPVLMNFGQQPFVHNSKSAVARTNNFVNKKKQIKIENETEELDPVLQPRDFLTQVTGCTASEDI